MTALPVSTLPIDPTPPPPSRATGSAGGAQFFSLVQNAPAQPGSGGAAQAASNAAAAAPGQSGAAATGNGAATAANAQSGAGQDGSARQRNDANAASAAAVSAVVIPLPVPMMLAQPLPTGSAASGAAAASTGNAGAASSATTQAAGPTSANVIAQLMATTALNIAAAGTPTPISSAPSGAPQSVSTAPAQAASAAKVFAALTASTGQPGNLAPAVASATASTPAAALLASAQPLPAVAGTMGMRIASSATQLVSQPSAALAPVAPDADKPSPGKPGAEAALSALEHAAATPPDGHTANAPNASSDSGFDQLLAGAAKANAAASQSIARDATDDTASKPAVTTDASAASMAAATQPVMPTTPTPPADSTPALPILPHSVSEQVAVNLTQAVKNGSDHIQIQLQPADLGAVQVKLSINHDGRVTMVVSADRSDTLNLLQQGASGLTQALRDAGLQADSSSLSFNLRGGYQFNQQQSAGYAAAAGLDDLGGIDAVGTSPAPVSMLRAHSGSLDIQV